MDTNRTRLSKAFLASPAAEKLKGSVSREIFVDVLEAMQNAEELGGPEGQEYSDLMEAIAAEAKTRLENYQASGRE